MTDINKKIGSGTLFVSLLFAVGIFFGGSVAFASNFNSGVSMMDCANEMPEVRSADCVAQKNLETKKAGPINNSFMPCCIERHDNSETALPSILQDRTKFSESAALEDIVIDLSNIEQKTYLSSKSPPKKADILSSVVKKE